MKAETRKIDSKEKQNSPLDGGISTRKQTSVEAKKTSFKDDDFLLNINL